MEVFLQLVVLHATRIYYYITLIVGQNSNNSYGRVKVLEFKTLS